MSPFDLVPELLGCAPEAEPPGRGREDGDPGMRRQLRRKLRRAIGGDALRLQFMPRHALADGAWLGAEAAPLLPSTRLGTRGAAPLAPLADGRDRLGHRLAAWVIAAACAAALSWPEHWTVGVDLPAHAILDGGLPGHVAAALAATSLSPERLDLELDEAMLLSDDMDLVLMFAALRDLGVGLVVKGFGARHACLAALRRLPLTGMRLDAGLVRGLPGRADNEAVLRAAVMGGLGLGLAVSADGVTTDTQRAFLLAIGCGAGQGPYYGAPLTAADLQPPDLWPPADLHPPDLRTEHRLDTP